MTREPTSLVVDLDGLPRRVALPTPWGVPHLVAFTLFGLGVQGLVRIAFADGGLVLALVSVVAVLGGATGMSLVGARSHLRLDPDGLRRHDGTRLRRRVRAWSTVREVRPSSRWDDHPELRGARASDESVALVGWTDDDAGELGRRLAAAQRSALDAAAPSAPSTTGSSPSTRVEVVVDLGELPQRLVAPLGGRRWRIASALGLAAGGVLVAWSLLRWLVLDGAQSGLLLGVGALLLVQGGQSVLLGRHRRVLLRPTGVVVEGAPDDREQAWSARTRVRLPSRWQEPPRLLDLHGGPVTLWGLDEQQALLLRRRLEEAVARAAAVDGSGKSDEGQVTLPG